MSKQGDSQSTAENDSTGSRAPRASARKASAGAGGAGLLILLLGVCCLVLGAAIVALPRALPHQAWIAHSASNHGLPSGVLLCGGLILCSIASAVRTIAKRIARASERSNSELLLEQLAGDLAQMRVGVQDLRVEIMYAKDSLAGIVEHQRAEDEAAAQAGSQEAIFRMAASLDQVGAKLDQRIKQEHATLQQSLAELGQTVESTRATLAAALSGVGAQGAIAAPESQAWNDERQPGSEAIDGDMQVWVELEEPVSSGLGLLDSLDDDGQLTSPAPSRMRMSHRETPPLEMGLGLEPAAPLPHANSESTPGNMSVEEKLEHLKGLLADPRVRAALDSMRRV